MSWIMAFLGAVIGYIASESWGLLGALAGFFIGFQIMYIRALRQRLDALQHYVLTQLQHADPAARRQPPATPVPSAQSAGPVQAAPASVAPPATPLSTTATAAPENRPPQEPDDRSVAVARHAAAQMPDPAQPPIGPAPMHPAAMTSTASPADMHTGQQPETAWSDRIVTGLKNLLFSGNVPVKIGMLVLLFGVAAALKYSVDAGWLRAPMSVRLALIAAGGLVMVLWGWKDRVVRPVFGLSLQGGGIGIMLLTAFAAYRLYQLLPANLAFVLVLVLVAASAALAVLQNAAILAVLGFLGGYLAPILLSVNDNFRPVPLFCFYAILNLAVLGIAWVRNWRALNLMGFFFTFGMGWFWGVRYYRPELYASIQPFLILFFLFYVAITVLHTVRPQAARRGWVDVTLVFGTPLLAFPMQAALLVGNRMGLAWSAMALAVMYAALTVWLLRRHRAELLGQCFGALAIGFATLSVPLASSARWTSAAWAVQGAALVWIGLRQNRLLARVAGLVLQVLAGLAYLFALLPNHTNGMDLHAGWFRDIGEWPLLNAHALCVLLLSLSAFFIAWMHDRYRRHPGWIWPAYVVGSLWWAQGGLREVEVHRERVSALLGMSSMSIGEALLLLAAFTLLLLALVRRFSGWARLGWNVLISLMLGLPLAMLLSVFGYNALQDGLVALLWPLWFGIGLMALFLLREPEQRGLGIGHIAWVGTLAWVYGMALRDLQVPLGADWRHTLTFLPLIVLVGLAWRRPAIGAFPLADRFAGYARYGFWIAGVVLALGWLDGLQLAGDVHPLPFLPLLNPVELLQLIGLIVAVRVLYPRFGVQILPWLGIAALLSLSMAGLRAVHQYTGLPWSVLILNHGISQTVLTVLWAVAGVFAWVMGSRRQVWALWLIGAVLMGLVLGKLILVDRLYTGNITGIVSFIAVGLLLVLVGRIAPTPPRHSAAAREEA